MNFIFAMLAHIILKVTQLLESAFSFHYHYEHLASKLMKVKFSIRRIIEYKYTYDKLELHDCFDLITIFRSFVT